MTEPAREHDVEASRVRLRAYIEALTGPGPIPFLDEALTHPSFANESDLPHNQRLEFLGDAVLGLVVSEELVRLHPDAQEGELTRMRATLVNTDALAVWGREIGLGDALALGRGARVSSEMGKPTVLADAVEAVIAAVYLARGMDGAKRLIEAITAHARGERESMGALDPKSALQDLVQRQGKGTPKYNVVRQDGPPHDRVFEVEVAVGDKVVGLGSGRSKRAAERAAATEALTGGGLKRLNE